MEGYVLINVFEKELHFESYPGTLHKIPKFRLISCCGNFVKTHSFRRVSGKSPETQQKLCVSKKFPQQEIR